MDSSELVHLNQITNSSSTKSINCQFNHQLNKLDNQLNSQFSNQSNKFQIKNHHKYHFNLFSHLKSNLINSMSIKRCLIFICIVFIHLSSVQASSDQTTTISSNINIDKVNNEAKRTDDLESIKLDDKLKDELFEEILKAEEEENKEEVKERTFLNEFAIELDSSTCPAHTNCKKHLDKKANDLADKHGFVNHGQIGQLDGHYLFRHHGIEKRSTEYANHHHDLLDKEEEVLWVEQQEVKIRKKRDNEKTSYRFTDTMPDPLFNDQWYLVKGAKGGFDMNVERAWKLGYTGKGVVVTILDDGIQPNHPDLELNYDPMASYDINDDDPDPTPQDNGDNKHGTRCAGEVAGQAYNEFCGVGIAFNASVGGVRMLDGTVTDTVEAKALSLNSQHIDIYSASWGPEDDGRTVDGPGRLAKRAFFDGITKGRRGLGSIYVWASGNGGRRADNCNCDGYTDSVYTLSISSATQAGTKPWYLEECSSTLATTYSSGTPGKDGNIVTVDMDTSYFKSLAKNQNKWGNTSRLCTKSHTGTSASAPIAAAICALALEANMNLTWRDMQHLVVLTSRYEPLQYEPGWQTNAVGRRYSHKFGFGMMSAEAMVKHAEVWRTVPKQQICETRYYEAKAEIPRFKDKYVETSIFSSACTNSTLDASNVIGEQGNAINYLEHVQAKITLKFRPRGSLKITLISPSGTKSDLLLPRMRDTIDDSFNNWPFLSVHFWGEHPVGKWTLRITNTERDEDNNGYLLNWALVFYGTQEKPDYPQNKLSRRQFSDNIDKKSVGIDQVDTIQQQQQQPLKNFNLPFYKAYPSLSNSVIFMIVIMCIVFVIFIFMIVQMSYWPSNVIKNHTYRRLNNLDDEDKLFSVNSEEMNLTTRHADVEISLLKNEDNSQLV